MGLTLRQTKGSALTYAEMDGNLTYLSSSLSQSVSASYASQSQNSYSSSYAGTASLLLGSIESASYAATSSQALTASYALNASTFPYTGSAVITGSFQVIGNTTITGSVISTGGFTGSLQGSSSYSTTSSYTVGALTLTPSNSLIIPTTSSFPTYTGTEGEIKPVVSGSLAALSVYISGSWQQYVPSPRTYTVNITHSALTGSLFNTGIGVGAGLLGLSSGYAAKFYRDQTTITHNSFGAPWTSSGILYIKENSGAQIVNQINQGELVFSSQTTHQMLVGDPYKMADGDGIYIQSNNPITASHTSSFIRIKLFYDIVKLSDL